MLFAYCLAAGASVICDFATTWWVFMLGIIILGCGCSPFITLTFVLLSEISGV